MKIAFTSCCDAINDPVQQAWSYISQHKPTHLVLLGDNIYMDYCFGDHPYKNGAPRNLPLSEFATYMHARYAHQWSVVSFKAAIQASTVYAIWDDHDFGWNNARGGAGDDESGERMPADYRRVSRRLFEQFRTALREKPAAYPAIPFTPGTVPTDLGSISQTVDLSTKLRLHLLDGRSFRESPDQQHSLLGETQLQALSNALLASPSVNLLASGTTFKDWKRYLEGDWLKSSAEKHRIVMLSGDVHEPNIDQHGALIEATASAIAQPPRITSLFGKKTGIYGLIQMEEAAISISVWQLDRRLEHVSLSLVDWSFSQ